MESYDRPLDHIFPYHYIMDRYTRPGDPMWDPNQASVAYVAPAVRPPENGERLPNTQPPTNK